MEEVSAGPQLAPPPLFFHQSPFPQPSATSAAAAAASPSAAQKRLLSHHPSPPSLHHNTWNSDHWSWDTSRFIAKPLLPNSSPSAPAASSHLNNNLDSVGHDDALRLNLGSNFNPVAEPASRPIKRVRSGSPASSTPNYPVCQVDNCREDLSAAKDYHRRHKVCELHSKSTHALLANQMQRFCQQCSRFHPLSEFDKGKRSCRRRLAGHNRSRRKTQP